MKSKKNVQIGPDREDEPVWLAVLGVFALVVLFILMIFVAGAFQEDVTPWVR